VVHPDRPLYAGAETESSSRVDFAKGAKDVDDVRNLLGVLGIVEIDPASKFWRNFSRAAARMRNKQRFVLKNILPKGAIGDAPRYPRGSDPEDC